MSFWPFFNAASDFYFGGAGECDTLRIVFSDTSAAFVANIQSAIAAFETFIASNPPGWLLFSFQAEGFGFDLYAAGFEKVDASSIAIDDSYNTDEDTIITGNVLDKGLD